MPAQTDQRLESHQIRQITKKPELNTKNNWSEIFVPFKQYFSGLKSEESNEFDSISVCLHLSH